MIKDITNIAKTRKFWIGVLNAAATGVLVFVADKPEFAPVIAILSAFGIYRVPNARK